MIHTGAHDFNRALAYAAGNNHLEIVQLMIEKGANDFDRVMAWAAENNHLEMVQISLRDWLKTILVLFAIFD